MNQYVMGRLIGEGASGRVFRVTRKVDSKEVVLKQINLYGASKREQELAMNEVKILARLDHPNIIKYFDSFQTEIGLCIVMELAERGNLMEKLKAVARSGRKLPEDSVWLYFAQIVSGLQYLHSKKVLHRDLKTLNIFLGEKDEIKIGDLGVAKTLDTQSMAHTFVGTPLYLSPELCEGKPYNEKSDVWALGCVLYELCTLRHPFEANNQAQLIMKILRGKVSLLPTTYGSELQTILSSILSRDPKNRPSSSQLLRNPKVMQHIKPKEDAESAKTRKIDQTKKPAAPTTTTGNVRPKPTAAAAAINPPNNNNNNVVSPSNIANPASNPGALASRRVRVKPGTENKDGKDKAKVPPPPIAAAAAAAVAAPKSQGLMSPPAAMMDNKKPPNASPQEAKAKPGVPVKNAPAIFNANSSNSKPKVSDLRRLTEKSAVEALPDHVTPTQRTRPKNGSSLDFRGIDIDDLMDSGSDDDNANVAHSLMYYPIVTAKPEEKKSFPQKIVVGTHTIGITNPLDTIESRKEEDDEENDAADNVNTMVSDAEQVLWRVVEDGEASNDNNNDNNNNNDDDDDDNNDDDDNDGCDDDYNDDNDFNYEDEPSENEEENDEAILQRAQTVETSLLSLKAAVVSEIGETEFQRLYNLFDKSSTQEDRDDEEPDTSSVCILPGHVSNTEAKERILACIVQIIYLEDTLSLLADELRLTTH